MSAICPTSNWFLKHMLVVLHEIGLGNILLWLVVLHDAAHHFDLLLVYRTKWPLALLTEQNLSRGLTKQKCRYIL